MLLSPDFNPYGGEWFDTIADLSASVEHLSEKSLTAEGAQGHQGRFGHQGSQGATGKIVIADGLPVPALNDSLALNSTIYYSVNKQALVYKDEKGIVLKLAVVRE